MSDTNLPEDITVITNATRDILLDKNPDALILYFFYIRGTNFQKTNSIWHTDTFVMKGLGWGREKLRKAKKLLAEVGHIEEVKERDEKGTFSKSYVKVRYLWKKDKKEAIIRQVNHVYQNPHVDEPTRGSTHTWTDPHVDEPTRGFQTTNALSNYNINALSNLNTNALNNLKKNALSNNTDFSKNFLEQIANTYQVPMSFVESCLDDCLRYMESYGLEEKIVNKQAYFSSWVKRNKLEFLRKEKSNELRNNIKITRIS